MKITPFLWFDDNLGQALELYARIFPEFRAIDVQRSGPGPDDAVVMATFELAGVELMGLNGGPIYPQTEAFSLFVSVDGQQEVDRLWAELTADGGQESQCGWLKDPFGVSWQIIPTALMELLGDPDPGRSQRARAAMLEMQKIDIAGLQRAADGE